MIIKEEPEAGFQFYQNSPSTNSTQPREMHPEKQSFISYIPKDVEPTDDDERKPLIEKVDVSRREFLKSFTVEPLLAMYILSLIARAVCNQNLLIDKSCLYVFHKPSNVCSNLDNYTDVKKQIETYSNNYNLYVTLVQTVPAVFFSMVIAPWSDKYGRKLPIVISIIGGTVENIGTILNVVYFDAPLYFLLLSGIPAGICGGMISVILCVYSLASEQTSQRQRTIKYAFLELAIGIAAPLGTLLGGQLYKNYGYLSVYIFSASFQLAALLWAVLVVKETKPNVSKMNYKAICDLFCIDNFKESFRTITKPRENGLRMEISLLIASICTVISTLIATSGFSFYFAKWMYNFDVTFFSNVSTIFICCGMVASVVVVVVSSRVLKLKNTDAIYGIIGSISTVATNIGKAVAVKVWIYYVASALGILCALAPLAVRSRLSKIVKEDELGKVFAFLSSCEALTPVVLSVAYTQIFNTSIDFFPGLAYTISGVIALLPLGTFIWVFRKQKKSKENLPE